MKLKLALNILLLAVTAWLFAGCATQRIDWAGRVGHYTLDQAVVDFGPPDKQFRLGDGRLVDELITRNSSGGSVMVGTGFYSRHTGVGIMQSTGPSYYEHKLRLTFTPDNVLAAWFNN
jgi:hypothetical protein